MLVVKTYIASTGVKGIGLFAAETISAGTVWFKEDHQFNRIFTKTEVDEYPPIVKDFLDIYSSLRDDGSLYLRIDNARFVNHSDRPNTKPQNHIGPDGSGDWVATRDIAVGEEITSDYRFVCEACRNGLCFENKES